jgi:acetyl-CoA carboxylase carboxyl transferase subunit alpha
LLKSPKNNLSVYKKAPTPKEPSGAWKRVLLARHPQRPYTLDYVKRFITDFQEIHGDRLFSDDHAIVSGFGFMGHQRVFIIGHQKGREIKENIKRNWGMPNPEGYRKALRVLKMAEKFKRPVLTFIDTAGAYPGLGGEERGQSEAIARNLLEMARLRVPIVASIIGEGGSGGALGIGVANRVLMLENSVYSVISPEGCAAILWNDPTRTQNAADAMRMTAQDQVAANIVDEVVPEPGGGAHTDHDQAALNLRKAIEKNLNPLLKLSPAALEQQRYEKFRSMGVFQEK